MEQQAQEGQQGQTATAAQAVTQPAQRTRATRTAPPAKRTVTRAGTPNGHGPAATDAPSVSVALPKDCYDWFAAEAEKDERTLNQFLRRTLRDVWQQQTAKAVNQDPTGRVGIGDDPTMGLNDAR